MDMPKQGAKDPAVGCALSFFVPGLGHLYAGRIGAFVAFLAIELWLLSIGAYFWLGVVHTFQTIAAGGAVKNWNARNGLDAAASVAVPPPPPAGTGRAHVAARPTPPPPPPPVPAPPPTPVALDADGFLEEIQAAWREHRAGHTGTRHFSDRKWRAIRAVRVEHEDEAHALVAAARELSSAGVLTSEEIGQLASRVGAA